MNTVGAAHLRGKFYGGNFEEELFLFFVTPLFLENCNAAA
jgi:hypothetical protein